MGRRTGDIISNVGVKEEDEEESLSLCDLPMNEGNDILQSDKESPVGNDNNIIEESGEEEFNFSDSFTISREYSEMCAADELFFQGQILPLRRHSVSYTTTDHTGDATGTEFINSSRNSGGSERWQTDHIRFTGKNSRSDSLDRCYSGGLTSTATSSRSSSINSHHSSSSGSSSASASAAVSAISKHNKKPPNSRARPLKLVPNHFQYYSSHPSPKPQIRTSSGNKTNSNKNSGLWSLFRVGLMTPPEIAIGDLKNRSNSIKNYNPQSFGSRNSSTSSNSNTTSTTTTTTTTTKTIIPAKRKHPFFFNKNGALLFGGCKCTVSSVFSPNNPTGNGEHEEAMIKQQATKMTKHHLEGGGEGGGGGGGGGGGKQALSRHRTFEWLKQLSLEALATDHHQT